MGFWTRPNERKVGIMAMIQGDLLVAPFRVALKLGGVAKSNIGFVSNKRNGYSINSMNPMVAIEFHGLPHNGEHPCLLVRFVFGLALDMH